MNLSDSTPPPLPNPQPEMPVLPRMSLFARLLNVFAVPGHVFDDVVASRHSISNWLVPLLLAAVVGVVTVIEIARPSIIEEVRTQYKTATDEQVKAGKLQAAEAEKGLEMLNWLSSPPIVKVLGTVVSVAFSALRILFWAFLIWWLGTMLFRVRFPFGKALEVSGLASMISVLAAIAALVLTANFGSDTGTGLSLEQIEAQGKMPIRIVLANIFSIWFVGVLASGLARLAGVRFNRAMMLVLGCWLALQLLLGIGAVSAFGLMK